MTKLARSGGLVLALVATHALARPPPVAQVAVAADGTVQVQADIVFASTKAGEVDPSLKKMQDTLAAKVKYQTLKKLSSKTLQLTTAAQTVTLPNGKAAEVQVTGLKDGVATIRVKLPPADTTYTLGREKSFYLQGGPHEAGELWLVLSQPK